MQDTEIYAKTDAGREEIRSRSLGLTTAARAILLMVDGQRTVAAMRTLIAGSKASPDVLDELLGRGLIGPRTGPSSAAGVTAPRPAAGAPAPPIATALAAPFDAPLDLLLPTIVAPEAVDTASLVAAAPMHAIGIDAAPRPAASAPDRYEHLYTTMNGIVRDFLPPHRRFFFQLKIERCGSAENLLELLPDLQTALTKARGEAFAADVVSRLRNAAG